MRWRIRHKLTLSLFLVVGIMALLLAGTLKGLLSYRSTMKTMNDKLEELRAAQTLQEAAGDLHAMAQGENGVAQNAKELLDKITLAHVALNAYRFQLGETIARGRDEGYDETALAESIGGRLRKLGQLAQTNPGVELDTDPASVGKTTAAMRNELAQLDQEIRDLQDRIHTDLNHRIDRSRDDYHMSLTLVGCTSVLGAVFLIGLARLAYRWISHPIRDLHEKVVRLAQGNFDSRIEVQSADEMQDLAEAFNHMTERLQAIYRDLARQVNERSRQLVRSERLAGVGFLAAGVAHEINNPLASIAFCGEALERRLLPFLDDQQQHPEVGTLKNYLKLIQQEAFRCKDITQKLLEFSRVGERQRQQTDLVDLIQSVIDMVLHLQSYKGKQIVFEPRRGTGVTPVALVNGQEIKSVILNLAVNALDSMDEGGTLTISVARVGGQPVAPEMAVMTFKDTGCGMTPEVLENIFEPFFTRSRTGKGTGLGLSISHRVITQHGGEIEAASPGPNQGSTFTVRLPLTAAPVESVPLAA